MTNTFFNEVMREFDKDAMAAKQKLETRKALLYQRLPRIAQIDKTLSQIGLSMVQNILKRQNSDEFMAEQKANHAALTAEREQLLYENGYDEDFFTDIYKCRTCQDTGFIEEGRLQCKCLKQRIISRYFRMSNLGKVFEEENFDAFNLNYYSEQNDQNFGLSPRTNMKRVWEMALSFVENFGKEHDNLLLYGSTGLGKTFLTNCIAGELLQKGHTVLYTTAPQLFRHVEEERFGKNENKGKASFATSFAFDADLLIIDDLGTEFATVVTDSELFNFINTRLLSRKPTIISTNLTLHNITTSYSDRITSRIYGNYIPLHFFGEDIRIDKKHGML